MDIRKLQSAIVDGLEDVKAQDILVFDTEHLSPLFERVIIASGSSNRQAKALAASVRDAVRAAGFQVLRTEGQDNGEWIIVDCAAAVVHIMQPVIRQYYHLEDIWGEKPVVLQAKIRKGLVKASEEDQEAEPAKKASGKKTSIAATSAKKAPAKKVAAKKAVAKKATGKSVVAKKAPAKKVAAKKVVAKKSASHVTKIVVNAPKPAARKAAVKKAVGKKVASKKVAVKKVAAKKVVAKKAPSRSGKKG